MPASWSPSNETNLPSETDEEMPWVTVHTLTKQAPVSCVAAQPPGAPRLLRSNAVEASVGGNPFRGSERRESSITMNGENPDRAVSGIQGI